MGHVGDGEGGPSSAAGARDKSLPSTPAAPAPAAPAAPGGPAVTAVDSGSDDDDRGPKTFSNTTGQSTAPVVQHAEMAGSSRVPRVPKAEMTESSRVPKGSRFCWGMIPTVSPHHHNHFRVEALAACGRFRLALAGGGRFRNSDGVHAIEVARRGSHDVGSPNVKRAAPPWMTSPILPHAFGKQPQHQRSTAASMMSTPCAPARKNALAAVENDGLLVRGGGGGGVVASAPLGALVVVTAYLTAALERRTKLGAIVGSPLLSFATFCLLSNLGLVPSTHAVYDLCWSFLLPLSLSIIILCNPAAAGNHDQRDRSDASEQLTAVGSSARVSIGPMGKVGLSFLVGAVGSVAGVAASFRVATMYGAEGWAVGLPRSTAAQIAGAVVATYVGGSVNLFAVASAVGLIGAKSAGGASLLGALAASDIFLMALYFSGLMAAHKAPFLRRIFPAAAKTATPARGDGPLEIATPLQGERGRPEQPAIGGAAAQEERKQSSHSAWRTVPAILALGGAICRLGNAAASLSPLPGTSTMAVTLLTVCVTRVLTRLAPKTQARFSRAGAPLATVLLNAFFGSVGASGRWAEVVGVAPAIFAFASIALGMHISVMVAGAAVLNRCCGAGLSIDDLIVASNANIGGPSTSATFAGLIRRDELVVPAAVWGTVGYAMATTLGVGVWTLLR